MCEEFVPSSMMSDGPRFLIVNWFKVNQLVEPVGWPFLLNQLAFFAQPVEPVRPFEPTGWDLLEPVDQLVQNP